MQSGRRRSRSRIGRSVEAAGGWLLLVCLAVAPWWYGSTRIEAIWGLGCALTFSGTIGLAGCLLKGRGPRVPAVCWAAGVAVVVLGWWMAPAADWHVLSAESAEAVSWNLERWPMSTTWRSGMAMAMLATGMVGALLLAADLARDPRWRGRFLFMMIATGVSLAVFGIVQTGLGWENIFGVERFGEMRDRMPGHFFATFFHHSSAAAFFNLVWPLAAGLLFGNFFRAERIRDWRKALLWGICGVAIVAAVLVNVSKAGMLFAVLLGMAFLVWPGFRILGDWSGKRRMAVGAVAVAVFLAGGFLAVETGRAKLIGERWEAWFATVATVPAAVERAGGIPAEPPFDRLAGARVSLEMIGESGFWGFGPGSWIRTFPDFAGETDFQPFWLWMQFAHQDYLQILVEWGIAGGILWGILYFGALVRVGEALWNGRKSDPTPVSIGSYAIGLSLFVLLLHAFGDFPLQIPSIQLYAMVLAGMCWSSPDWRGGLRD